MRKIRVLGVPYVIWMCAFIVVPMVAMVYFALQSPSGGFTLENLKLFFTRQNGMYVRNLWDSVVLAAQSTALCVLLGYPVALLISWMPEAKRGRYLVLMILPTWMNFLLRTYSWVNLLAKNGIINRILAFLALPEANMLYTRGAVLLGMIYNFLPYMIYPIYSVLIKISPSYMEAARDLGAGPVRSFLKVTVPLSMPGVITGITMVFMPAVSTFVIPELLGGSSKMYFGNLIQSQYQANNMPMLSTMSLIMMAFILVTMFITNHFDSSAKKESALW